MNPLYELFTISYDTAVVTPIKHCAEPEPEFGPPLPPVVDEQALKQAFAPLTGADPRDFLSSLLSFNFSCK